jgi:hypothetical protein
MATGSTESTVDTCIPGAGLVPFSLLFAVPAPIVPPIQGDQTIGAETETETSVDGTVRKDTVEDEDVDR